MSEQIPFLERDVSTVETDLEAWLHDAGNWVRAQTQDNAPAYLLAHADDGIIWGQISDAGFSRTGAALDKETLLDARVFGEGAEILLWCVRREGGKREWRARAIHDNAALDSFSETYWLWGVPDTTTAVPVGFTALIEKKQQGMRHAPPIAGLGKADRAGLVVKHYVAYDDVGQAYVAQSRLAGLTIVPNGGRE